jgi:Hemerythrin HHE cation binding domain
VTELWRCLQAEHDRIWDLLDRITGGSGDPQISTRQQRRTAKLLVALQSGHELTEERIIWPVVRRACRDGADLVAELLQQEHQLKLALHDLAHLSAGTDEFTQCVNTVASHERTHLTYEQNQIWPRLADELNELQASELLRAWTAARGRAPTRPHPHLPARPGLLRTAGPVLALLDRTRDLASGLRAEEHRLSSAG